MSMFEGSGVNRFDPKWQEKLDSSIVVPSAILATLQTATCLSKIAQFIDVCLLIEGLLSAAATMHVQNGVSDDSDKMETNYFDFQLPSALSSLNISSMSKYFNDCSVERFSTSELVRPIALNQQKISANKKYLLHWQFVQNVWTTMGIIRAQNQIKMNTYKTYHHKIWSPKTQNMESQD